MHDIGRFAQIILNKSNPENLNVMLKQLKKVAVGTRENLKFHDYCSVR